MYQRFFLWTTTLILASQSDLYADRRLGERQSPQYRKQWAVVIGINYSHLTGESAAEVPALQTAEADARSVVEQLRLNYGYTDENIRLLLGKDATAGNIRRSFGEGFLGDPEQVTAADAVLFYFAGHGNRRETTARTDNFVGLLYPADVHTIPGKGVDTSSCLRIDDVLESLRDLCHARHKLVILDSCHSGEVFNFQGAHRSGGINHGFRWDLFKRSSFQAIAAARASQKASDVTAGGGHSPFTACLLDALNGGAFQADRQYFTASELIAYIPKHMPQQQGVSQDPQGNWLAGGGEGDFYFFWKGVGPPAPPSEETRFDAVLSPRDAEPDVGLIPTSAEPVTASHRFGMLMVAGGVMIVTLSVCVVILVLRLANAGQSSTGSSAVTPESPQPILPAIATSTPQPGTPGEVVPSSGPQNSRRMLMTMLLTFGCLSLIAGVAVWQNSHPPANAAVVDESYPLEIPLGLRAVSIPSDNPMTVAKVELGKQLFFDQRLSANGEISCATCHDPTRGWTNGRSVATGVNRKTGTRNVPTLVNVAYRRFLFWDGRAHDLEEQSLAPFLNPVEMGVTLEDLEKTLNQLEGYHRQFEAIFGSPPTAENAAKAIAAFERTILAGNAPYDRFLQGDKTAMSEPAQLGMELFFGKAHCSACHRGPDFTDGAFHNIGIGTGTEPVDHGRQRFTSLLGDQGSFGTPSLREVSRTAPYMHDGSLKTLAEVIEYYNQGGMANPQLDEEIFPLKLSDQEKSDLETFLHEGLNGASYPIVLPPRLPE